VSSCRLNTARYFLDVIWQSRELRAAAAADAVGVNTLEWHTGDTTPRILSDSDTSSCSSRSVIVYSAAGAPCPINTLRHYGLSDGAVVALTPRQLSSMSTTSSSVHSNSFSRRLPQPRAVSRPAGLVIGDWSGLFLSITFYNNNGLFVWLGSKKLD